MTEKDSIHFLTKEEIIEPSTAASNAASPADTEDKTGTSNEGAALSQSAYDERTGEINWDCPCLGGMANGPCGEEFKSAFSCFVTSEADPKGADCLPLFQQMQSCFRDYPEYYADQLEDDDDIKSNEPQMMTNEEPEKKQPVFDEAPPAATEELST